MMTTLSVLLGSTVAVGAVVGALLRWQIGLLLNHASFLMNWGTLLVNVVGSALAGLLFAWHQAHPLPHWLWLMLVVGFLGGFTTFSAYSLEFLNLLLKGELFRAALHMLTHVGLSLVAVILFFWLSRSTFLYLKLF